LSERHVSPLSGAFNFRDLGGLSTVDGRRTRYGRLFRSDTLQALTDDDVARLLDEYHITFVIDLRTAEEAVSEGRGPLGRLSVCYANVPLVDVDSPFGEAGDLVVNQYLDHLEHDPNLVIALDLLAHTGGRPTVFHCAAGKDRTGVVTALLLRIIGVAEEDIVADYLATAQNMERIVARFREWPRYRRNMATLPAEIYRCEEHVIRKFLRELDSRYGNARDWARQKGLSKEAITRLESVLLDDG